MQLQRQSAASDGRTFREVPIFDQLRATAFSYAFELTLEKAAGWRVGRRRTEPARTAFRLRDIQAALARETGSATHAGLVEPLRSFLDDVTNGGIGSNGRPLIFAASGSAIDSAERRLTLIRPECWRYEFEGECTELHVPDAARRTALRLQDGFCVFESGRIFYVLTLTQPLDPVDSLDEYGVLQLQQLAIEPELRIDDAEYLGFEWEAETGRPPLSLLALAERRLQLLEAEAVEAPNGVASILRRHGLLRPQDRRRPLAPDALRSLCVAIEDERLLDTALRAERLFDGDRGQGSGTSLIDAEWEKAIAASSPGAQPPHRGTDDDFARSLLVFAGLAQGIPDFPYQDESEVHDSTRATYRSVESAMYVHPCFLMEVAKSWRTFNAKRPEIGTCPYLLLKWLVATHDELIVCDMEAQLDRMLYDADRIAARSEPMSDVAQVLDTAIHFFGSGNRIIERNLERRLTLFRWASIYRSGNLFRYPREREALAAVQQSMGTDARFQRTHETVDRIEALIEDVSNLKGSYGQARTNRILLALALLGVIGAAKDIGELISPVRWTSIAIGAGLAALLVLLTIGDRFARRR